MHKHGILNVKTSQTGALKQVFEKLHVVIPECYITFIQPVITKKKYTNGRIIIQQLSEDRSLFVKINLESENFDKFICEEPIIKIGVNVRHLYAMLQLVPDNNKLMLQMNKKNRDTLYISGIPNNDDDDEIYLELNLVSTGIIEFPTPQIKHMNKFTMNRSKFNSICKEFGNNTESVEITMVGDKISFVGHSEGGKITKTSKIDCNIAKEKKIEGKYELRNLLSFSKCNKLCDSVDVHLKNESPLVLEMAVATLGYMYIYLSPLENVSK